MFSEAELNVELSRPLKINPTLEKLEQAKAYLKKVLPNQMWDTPSTPLSTSITPHSSPLKAFPKAGTSSSDSHHQASALAKASSIKAMTLSFHKVSLQTAQIVVVMETEAHPMRPSVALTVSAMTGSLNVKSGPRLEGKKEKMSLHSMKNNIHSLWVLPWCVSLINEMTCNISSNLQTPCVYLKAQT